MKPTEEEKEMKRRVRIVSGVLLSAVLSCAVITVNVYFPEKDVREAYKTLEQELMTPEQKDGGKKPGEAPAGRPTGSLRFGLVSEAYAQEPGLAARISELIKRMPDVVNAYRDMGGRISDTDRLRDSGMVGEGKDGLLTQREAALSPADRKVVEMENADRRTVMQGMTRAIIRINRVPENEENMRQVMPQAVEQFAALRRDSAKKNWWIQDPSGNWFRK